MDALLDTLAGDPAHLRLVLVVIGLTVAITLWLRRLTEPKVTNGNGTNGYTRIIEWISGETRRMTESVLNELRAHEHREETTLLRSAAATEKTAEVFGRLDERFDRVIEHLNMLLERSDQQREEIRRLHDCMERQRNFRDAG